MLENSEVYRLCPICGRTLDRCAHPCLCRRGCTEDPDNLIEALALGAAAHVRVEGDWNNDLMTQVLPPTPLT